MNQALKALYELQRVDSALALANRRYKALDPGRAEQAAAETARALQERTAAELQETQRDLTDSELELKTVEKKKKDYEDKLYSGKVTNFKELESMQEEIAALGRQRARLDERILTLMDQLEKRRSDEALSAKALAEADAALAAKQAEHRTAARKYAGQIQALTKMREEQAPKIAAPLMKRYEAIRAHMHGVGIAPIGDDGLCGGCHTQLPSNLMTAVRETDKVLTCENCGRILCVAEATS